ncbi:MAG: transposase DNA-binding-containing protein, partial [Desulfobacteria bacterium]
MAGGHVFRRADGHRPLLLESFVDTSRFTGTCYRAANWIWIGRTKGRGRQDRFMKRAETVKDIYVYPLEKDFRLKMGLSEDNGLGALDLSAGIGEANWAEKELGDAPIGDARLSHRLVEIAADKAQ